MKNKSPLWRPSLDDKAVERIWERLEVPRRSRRWPMLLAVTAAVSFCVVLVMRTQTTAELRLENGVALEKAIATHSVLSDGSMMTPSAGAVVELLRNTPTQFSARQIIGHCRYEVTPGGPRQWTIETPLGTIEVTGTVFSIEASENEVTVKVERGQVVVHSAFRSQTVTAGESIRLQSPQAPVVLESASLEATPTVKREELPKPPALSPPPTASQVLSQAEAALAAGRADITAVSLERWLTVAPRNADWSVVALRLGTIEFENRKAPAAALRWFESAIEIGAPASTIEDAAALRILTLRTLGRSDEAGLALSDFQTKWPESAWLPTLGDASKP